MKKTNLKITPSNIKFAVMELDFTHDYSRAKVGSIFINRDGEVNKVTKIDKDCGNRRFWSEGVLLGRQYTSPHNMLTKQPFYAYEYKLKNK